MKHKYSVLLAYPDYLQNTGHDTYYAWVDANNPHKAAEAAQRKATDVIGNDVVENFEDFLPLAVFKGHIEMEVMIMDFP